MCIGFIYFLIFYLRIHKVYTVLVYILYYEGLFV
jgi:hypothetical protein